MNPGPLTVPTAPSDTRCVPPLLADRWTEEQGRIAVRQRSQGRCEGCGQAGDLQWAHRVRRGQGGLWHWANGLDLCHRCHAFAHQQPHLAQGLGWELLPGADPTVHAAWIRTPHRLDPGWHLLGVEADADGVRRHIVIPVEPEWTP